MSFETADLAFKVEQETLNWLRNTKKLQVFLSLEDMPQGGHTETVDASAIKSVAVWAKVQQLSKVKK